VTSDMAARPIAVCALAACLFACFRNTAFIAAPEVRGCTSSLRGPRISAPPQACVGEESASSASSRFAAGSVLGLAAVLLGLGRRSSRMTRWASHNWERKWWSVEETADPTTLPLWQRDWRYGFQLLKRTMHESRKKGKKVFWECRVLESKDKGCSVEMLKSGMIGWCPLSQEGPARIKVGDVVMMECIACPKNRVNTERKHSPWPHTPVAYKVEPVFSHYHWLEREASIAKAKELVTGDVIDCVVFKHVAKGLLMSIGGEDGPRGMLAMMDISRKMSSHNYVEKMFPPGTKMKCYIVHADPNNGRITLSTKEFEDDDHVGWMLSFPERCMMNADVGVERFKGKRADFIRLLQK